MDDEHRPDTDVIQRSFDLESKPSKTDNPKPLSIPANKPPELEEKTRWTDWLAAALWIIVSICLTPLIIVLAFHLHLFIEVGRDPEAGWIGLFLILAYFATPFFALPGAIASALLILFDRSFWRKLLAAFFAFAFSMGLVFASA